MSLQKKEGFSSFYTSAYQRMGGGDRHEGETLVGEPKSVCLDWLKGYLHRLNHPWQNGNLSLLFEAIGEVPGTYPGFTKTKAYKFLKRKPRALSKSSSKKRSTAPDRCPPRRVV